MSAFCTRCSSRPSIYYRPYSGERLCQKCFSETLIEKVKRTISKYNMFEFDSKIAVGVSGGKDSLVLLKILAEIEANRPYAELIALSIDEGIKGYRDEALYLVKKFCNHFDIELNTFSFQELFNETMDSIAGKERELSTCSYCGVLRRRALNEAAKLVCADRLATGHNLDDMAQSTLLNVLRGDISRLSALNPGGIKLGEYVRRVKPICEIPERETTLYAYYSDIEFQSIPCPYSEEAMRTDVRMFLNKMEEKHSGTKFITYQTGLKMSKNLQSFQKFNKCKICDNLTPRNICRVCELLEDLNK